MSYRPTPTWRRTGTRLRSRPASRPALRHGAGVRARGLQDREGSGDANGVAVTLLRVAASTPHLKSLKYPEPRFLWLLLLHHWVLLPVAFIPPRGSPARRRIKRLEGRPIASIYSLGGR